MSSPESQARIDADHPVPTMSVSTRPWSREVVIDFPELVSRRVRSMPWPDVVATMAEDYGVRVWRDDAGRTLVDVDITTPGEPQW